MKTNKIISIRFYTFLTFLWLTSISVTYAGKKTDFSGIWILNREKSELGERGFADNSKTINQEKNKLVVERKFTSRDGQEMSATDTYTLDGKECVNEGFGNSERKSTATWSEDGKALTIKTKVSFERNGETRVFEFTEIWTLSDDGENLIITSKSERGERKMVYDRQMT